MGVNARLALDGYVNLWPVAEDIYVYQEQREVVVHRVLLMVLSLILLCLFHFHFQL